MPKKVETKERTNWKQLAKELGVQVKDLTEVNKKLKESNEVNEHELIQITKQRDDTDKYNTQVLRQLQKEESTIMLAEHVLKEQQKIIDNILNVNKALNNIVSISKEALALVAVSGGIELISEEEFNNED